MDEADFAAEREEKERARAIQAAQQQANAIKVILTECANDCGDAPQTGSRFCGIACRDEFEARQAKLKRQGIR
jgi:hypothetical protein